jgi:NTP pyrophosphatase (non-canonical NTP hydrolase)
MTDTPHDRAIEAAAKALFNADKKQKLHGDWGLNCPSPIQVAYIAHANAAIEAYNAAMGEARNLSFEALANAARARDLEWNSGTERLSLTFRATELASEVGEACNVIKKLERERIGIAGSRATPQQAAEELADVIICTMNIAMDLKIDLATAVIEKFNATSTKLGMATMLASSPVKDNNYD